MRFKWGALLAVAALGWLSCAVLHCFLPYTMGSAIDANTGRHVEYLASLDLKRISVFTTETAASRLIQAYPAPDTGKGALLAYDSHWMPTIPGFQLLYRSGLLWQYRRRLHAAPPPVRTETDAGAEMALDNVADYLDDLDWQQSDGIRCGFTPEGKAQLLRNMLDVLRRGRPSHFVNRMVLPQLMRPLDHPAGPDEVPSASRIIRKDSQFY
jgi:hypothetical protein